MTAQAVSHLKFVLHISITYNQAATRLQEHRCPIYSPCVRFAKLRIDCRPATMSGRKQTRAMTNILAELKRRNVFKVATIYVVVSWLILQVATVVFPVFEIPNWASRLVVILLGLGFPLAILLAWAFDLTPEGITWQSDVGEQHVHTHAWDWILAALLVVAIGLMVISQIDTWGEAVTQDGTQAPLADVSASAPGAADKGPPIAADRSQNSIAVLPFDNLSADASDDYIGDGIAEELLGVLGRISELKVASRTSTAYFKNKNIDNAAIASTLDVENILSGSMRRAGDRIRVTAALDRADTGELLWTETYDRTLDDILDIQAEIAQSVASAIVPVLSPQSAEQIVARPTSSIEAYDYYLRGRDYLRQPAVESTLASAVTLFDKAIDLDARFAEAHAGQCEANLRSYEFTRRSDYFQNAEVSCHRALTLNGTLWEVRVALGDLYSINGQYDQAIFYLEAAIKQQPNAVSAYLTLAQVYATLGRIDEAEELFRQAEKIESGFWGVHRAMGHFYYDQELYVEAIKHYKKVTELAPDHGIGQDNLGNTYLAIGEFDLAEQAFNSSPLPSRWSYTNRGLVYYFQSRFSLAIKDQVRAIELAPDEHRAWGRLADAYRHSPGKEEEAAAAYDTAIHLAEQELSINPSDWDSVGRLGIYYAHTNRPDEALAQIDRLLELTSDSTAFYFASMINLIVGDRDKAYDFLRESIEHGFSRVLILNDPDLAKLREEREFIDIVGTTNS